MRALYPLLLFVVVLLGSCKKEALDSDAPEVLKNAGLLRVECNKCVINYQVNNKDYQVRIDRGSNDIAFFYADGFNLITKVLSKEEQKIRLLVMDSFGRVVSNELKDWTEGESRTQTFVIKIK
ncbi:hypothetical protein OQX61_01225 [Pedobacter sp. PLR]|uniref:hypothetical protein n=1 Tax=Pedobacter sp. PLR TaxID=2994465 RepID=UPI002247DCA1|nr:hypothetical protein [Pedobacter sp. PLR]MCX2449878.1 hypothetical protein [Pedobacter sp. PLR]